MKIYNNIIFIASCRMFAKLLNRLPLGERYGKNDKVKILAKNGFLQFTDYPAYGIYIESRDDFEINVEADKLERLLSILNLLEDQPVVIGYDTNKWLYLKEVAL